MNYTRVFTIQAAHFNDPAYRDFDEGMGAFLDGRNEMAAERFIRCMRNVHGHNFKITVQITGDGNTWSSAGWIVDDVALSHLILTWDNTNLSLRPEFYGDYSAKREGDKPRLRATTENMAKVLTKTIVEFLTTAEANFSSVFVKVEETPEIEASQLFMI